MPDAQGNPLPNVTVSLATQNSSDVTIELPELHIERLRTTATIPDGATLMLGGLKRTVDNTQHSTVPFLGEIPVIGSLFSRTGDFTMQAQAHDPAQGQHPEPGGVRAQDRRVALSRGSLSPHDP